MIEALSYPFVWWAFFICIVIVGIHSYLGSHVVRRGIIFTDLALAQFAVLGSVVGQSIGFEDHSWQIYVSSLGFALIASFLFSLIKSNHSKIPIEAMIGTGYAISSALTILLVVKTPESATQIKEMLVGSILLVSPQIILETTLFYVVISIIHYIFRKQIYARSNNEQIDNSILWDFVFYGTFSVVVTYSVQIAGVLLVFSFLVVPAIVSLMLSDSIKKQLIIGWLFGLTACIIGILLAITFDFPVGPMIVVILISMMLPVYIMKHDQ